MTPTWIDGFLFWDAVLVTGLMFADWLLGKKQRSALKERVAEWWLYLEEMSFSGLVSRDAGRVSGTFIRIFGARWWGIRRIGLSSLVSLIISFAFIMTEVPRTVYESELFRDLSWGSQDSIIPFLSTGPLFRAAAVPNAIAGWASLSLTIFLLTLMARSVNPLRLGILIVVDIAAAALLVLATFYVTVEFHLVRLDPDFPAPWNLERLLIEESIFPIAVIGSLPTFTHLAVVSVFLSSKILRPVLIKPVSLILLRLYESPKGVLSQLAVGLGAVAKLIQEGIKYFVRG